MSKGLRRAVALTSDDREHMYVRLRPWLAGPALMPDKPDE
jgi:hypothetical protein